MSYKRKSPTPVAEGGTGQTTLTIHGVLVGNTLAGITQLGVGATGQTLMGATGADPGWTSSPSFGGTVTAGTGVTVTTGNVGVSAGNITLPVTNVGGTAGLVTVAGNSWISNFGTDNIFIGKNAGNLSLTTASAFHNVCIGDGSGSALTSGPYNTCIGSGAGLSLTTGGSNVLIGVSAGVLINTGNSNTLIGVVAGQALTSGTNNVGLGLNSLYSLATGSYNIAAGATSGNAYTAAESSNIMINNTGIAGESNVCRIGNGTGTGSYNLAKTFIQGISGVTVTGSAVLISTGGQMGTIASSIRYKENIKDMYADSANILNLRPVTFNYKCDHDKRISYGLIAEEVAELYPNLVIYDEKGEAETVQYHLFPALLLNEIQKLVKRVAELENKLKE